MNEKNTNTKKATLTIPLTTLTTYEYGSTFLTIGTKVQSLGSLIYKMLGNPNKPVENLKVTIEIESVDLDIGIESTFNTESNARDVIKDPLGFCDSWEKIVEHAEREGF